MSTPNPRKRALCDSNGGHIDDHNGTLTKSEETRAVPESASLRKRDQEFWYGDGNVILLAGNVEFRVYQGLLAEKSFVFRDMLSLPQPPVPSTSTAPLADASCQATVHLSDSAEDIRHMLRVIMPKKNTRYHHHLESSWATYSIGTLTDLIPQPVLGAGRPLIRYHLCSGATWAQISDTYAPPAGTRLLEEFLHKRF